MTPPCLPPRMSALQWGSAQMRLSKRATLLLTNNQPSKLPQAIVLFRRCMRIIRFNITFALLVKGIVLLLGALSLAGMWAAVFADVGVTILAVLNSARILSKRLNMAP